MSRESLVYQLEQPSNAFCTDMYGKYNINTSQESSDTVQNFSSDLSNVAWCTFFCFGKDSDRYNCCFNSNPEFLSLCSDKSVIVTGVFSLNSGNSINDSNLNTADESLCGINAVSTCNW